MILVLFHTLVVVLGVLSMGFQLLASRLLNPHFGSSIVVWAWLISTFLAAFSTGSILGGWVCGLSERRRNLARTSIAAIGVASLALTALAGRSLLGWIEVRFEDMNVGLLVACAGLFFVPVTALSSFGPQCVQFLSSFGRSPGSASGLVYGISTLGNIAGVMLTAFVFIPNLRVSTLLILWLAVAVLGLGVLLALLRAGPVAR
ncbi:hypothetical protein ASA1KI_14310 [Opitutales bacterium ASA1]|uniref:fused MFS/spermidine synthase n=1 Tax=Congregicoccus parvus TaxID=3081749 RepID=UPI002B2C050D|nr:hypothetical protein ASA1KI_14310 [Opitutales bacterium ASA1]